MFKRILVPIDGSQTSTSALIAGLQMARETGATARILYTVNEMLQTLRLESLLQHSKLRRC
jgi:nucleotide-binding universal stress UspA family protein